MNLKKFMITGASSLMLLGFGGLIHQSHNVNADEVAELSFRSNKQSYRPTKYSRSDFKFYRPRALNEARNGIPIDPSVTYNKLLYRYLRNYGFTPHQIKYGAFHKLNESRQKHFGYHEGVPKALINTTWHGVKHYNRKHTHYSMVKFGFTNYAPGFAEYLYNRHNKITGGSAGSGSAWNAYYRSLGHHTYSIISGIGNDGSYTKLTKYNILHNSEPMMTSVKLLGHHRALIDGKYYTLAKHHSKSTKKSRKRVDKSRKHLSRSTKSVKRSHKLSYRHK